MTDQLRHFRGPLITIPRRIVKVGGGKLYSDQCGTATMRVRDGNKAYLANVLYVPGLGVNLLSGRRMCQKGLHGGFDKNSIWMRNEQGRRVLTADQQGGVYIVNKIAPDLNEFALIASMQYDSLVALPANDNAFDQEHQDN